MIVGISGLLVTEQGEPIGSAGAGKDTLADFLVEKASFNKLALADPLKRVLREVYDFTEDQLWGPSQNRNAPDTRYPRPHTWIEHKDGKGYSCACCSQKVGRNCGLPDTGMATQCYLTPRYALQLLGTEWGRHCFQDTWVEVAVRDAKRVLGDPLAYYNAKEGVQYLEGNFVFPNFRAEQDARVKGIAISDVRFKNEIDGLRARGAKLVRVKRVGVGLANAAGMHPSERESVEIPDSAFDLIVENNGTPKELSSYVSKVLSVSTS